MTLPAWVDQQAWDGWLEMRKQRKWVITERVIRMHLKTLEEFREQGWDIEYMIDEATNKNWREFYVTNRTPRITKPAAIEEPLSATLQAVRDRVFARERKVRSIA